MSEVARRYDVSWHTASNAIRGTTWSVPLEQMREQMRSPTS